MSAALFNNYLQHLATACWFPRAVEALTLENRTRPCAYFLWWVVKNFPMPRLFLFMFWSPHFRSMLPAKAPKAKAKEASAPKKTPKAKAQPKTAAKAKAEPKAEATPKSGNKRPAKQGDGGVSSKKTRT